MSRCAWSNDKELILVPYKSHHPCAVPGCPNLADAGQRYCEAHADRQRQDNRRIQNDIYDRRWRKVSKAFLAAHPLCVMCLAEGKLTPATVVDHIIPHRGDLVLFWDESGWEALCVSHHNRKTLTEDIRPEYMF